MIELTTPGSAVRLATNCAKGPGPRFLYACVISLLFSHPSVKTCILDAQKNRLNETILLSTHNICFGLERWKLYLMTHFYVEIWRKCTCTHRVGGNWKRYQQLTKADKKSIEMVFSIAICRQCGNKWQSKTLFQTIFNLHSLIVLAFSIAAYPVWCTYACLKKVATAPSGHCSFMRLCKSPRALVLPRVKPHNTDTGRKNIHRRLTLFMLVAFYRKYWYNRHGFVHFVF